MAKLCSTDWKYSTPCCVVRAGCLRLGWGVARAVVRKRKRTRGSQAGLGRGANEGLEDPVLGQEGGKEKGVEGGKGFTRGTWGKRVG